MEVPVYVVHFNVLDLDGLGLEVCLDGATVCGEPKGEDGGRGGRGRGGYQGLPRG